VRTKQGGFTASFIDYPNRTVLNGSRLGKEFSANVINDLFNSTQKQNITSGQTEEKQLDISPGAVLGSVSGLFDIPQSPGDYEEDVFIREQEYEEKRHRLKAKKKEDEYKLLKNKYFSSFAFHGETSGKKNICRQEKRNGRIEIQFFFL
jgi:hypothetical protein